MSKDDKQRVLVPRLRFPEFCDGYAWEQKVLGVLTAPINERVGDSDCVPYTVTSGEGLISQEEKYGRTIAGKSLKNYYLLQHDDFAFNKSATKVFPQGYIARFQGKQRAAVPNSIFTCFRVTDENVGAAYLDYLFQGNLHGRWLKDYITVGARAHGALNISDSDLFALPVPLPSGEKSLAEQQKIAGCLGSLDDLIAAEGRKLAALRDHKKGLMQQLFPREGETVPRLRFPEFIEVINWTDMPLDELAERGTGHTPDKKKPEYYNGGIKWVSLADSKRLDRGLISDTEIEISELGLSKSSAVLHPAGSVILSRDAGVGKSAILGVEMAVSQHFMVWRCNRRRLSNWFLYYYLQRSKSLFEDIATGSTIKTIGVPFFKAMRVKVPEIDEQHRIADCLSSLDALITAQAEKLDALRSHKRGLMQQLFPSPDGAT